MTNTPIEVLDAMLEDWRARGLTLDQVAVDMGYASKQALLNLIYRKRKSNSFLTKKEAERYVDSYDYNIDFLTKGEGTLREGVLDIALQTIDALQFEQLKLMSQLSIAYAIIKRASNTLACDALRAIAENNPGAYLAKMRALMESNGGYEEADAHMMVAYFACIRSLDELKKHFRNLDVPAITEMVRKEYEDIKETI